MQAEEELCVDSESESVSHLVMSDSLQHYGP